MTKSGRTTKPEPEKKQPRIRKERLKDLGVKSPDEVKGGVRGVGGETTRDARYC